MYDFLFKLLVKCLFCQKNVTKEFTNFERKYIWSSSILITVTRYIKYNWAYQLC